MNDAVPATLLADRFRPELMSFPEGTTGIFASHKYRFAWFWLDRCLAGTNDPGGGRRQQLCTDCRLRSIPDPLLVT
jgi:hypothetical protein